MAKSDRVAIIDGTTPHTTVECKTLLAAHDQPGLLLRSECEGDGINAVFRLEVKKERAALRKLARFILAVCDTYETKES